MPVNMYPLKFKPYLRTMVWGGEKIAPYKGIYTTRNRIGESWELSSVEGHVSEVANGPFAGKSLTEVMQRWKSGLVGRKAWKETGTEFPLLVKFIDARADLSIQVHPGDELAARTNPGQRGKTEMWYVVGADKGARLLSGLTQEITPEEYEERVRDNSITEVLARYDVRKGDVFFLPAGRIHAIGAGSFVAEIQQTSDITYRIYDYGRLGLDGKPRQLHIEQAKEAIDYRVFPDYRTTYPHLKDKEVPLVSCRYFDTSLFDLGHRVEKDLSGLDSFVVVICVEGGGSLVDSESDGLEYYLPLRQGETVLVPASSRRLTLIPDGSMTCLASSLP